MATRIEKLRQGGGGIAKTFMDAVFLRNYGGELTSDDVMSFPYKKSDLVYICISTTARAIGQIPLKVYEQVGEDEFKPLPRDNPWQQLFRRPNEMMDSYSFVEAAIGHLMLDGDVFFIPFPPGPNPASIWVVRKKFIAPIKDPKTNRLIGWNYNPKGVTYDSSMVGGSLITTDTIPLEMDEVCHAYFWNPYDPIMGQAPHEAGKMNIVIDYKASRYTSEFLDAGAVPGGMLQTDRSLTDPQFKRILEQFESRHQGYKKAHRFALLENGLKYTQTGLTQKDMEFPKLRELSARRTFQIYGMKEAVISETKNVNYATSREQRKEWWESTNLPMMRMVCSALNFTLFPKSNLVCGFDTTKIIALREAMADMVNTGYKLWVMGFTAEEVNNRLDLGFRPKPWRRNWYMPVNLVQVPLNGVIPASPQPPQLPPGESPPPPAPRREISNIVALDANSFSEHIRRLLPDKKKEERGEAIWNNMISRLAPLEEQFTKKMSRVFFNMRKRALELLYSGKMVDRAKKDERDLDGAIFSDEYKELGKVTEPLFKAALSMGFELVIEEISAPVQIPFSYTDPEVLFYLSNKQIKIVGIIDTVRERIRTELSEAFQSGESIDQIANRVRNVFDVARSRARTIARTEMGSAATEGRYLAISRSGFKEKEWFTAMDERVRIQHRAMHGRKIKIGEMWSMPDGSFLRHPGDYNGPHHQIINCRCIEIVVEGTHWTDELEGIPEE